MRESIDFGLKHRREAVQHAMPYARDMDTELAGKFIGMYVNDFTRDYGNSRASGDPADFWVRRKRPVTSTSNSTGRICPLIPASALLLLFLRPASQTSRPRKPFGVSSAPALKPFAKSAVPCWNRTTKQKVKKTKRASQNRPRKQCHGPKANVANAPGSIVPMAQAVSGDLNRGRVEPRATATRVMRVPLLDLTEQYRSLEKEILAEIKEVLGTHRFILGPKLEAFEKSIAKYCGIDHAIGVSSGTDALLAALMALEIGTRRRRYHHALTVSSALPDQSRESAPLRCSSISIRPLTIISPAALRSFIENNASVTQTAELRDR